MNRARFIATLGPSSLDTRIISGMVKYGVTSFRLNSAHISPDYVSKVKSLLKEVKVEDSISPSIILDLKGPEIRAILREDEPLSIVKGGEYLIGKGKGDFSFSIESIMLELKENDTILLSDGRIKLKVTENLDGLIKVRCENDGEIRNRARVNLPNKELNLGTLTDRDEVFLKEGIKEQVEFFALSFVQNEKNLDEIRKRISEMGGDQFVISKIETTSGVKNVDRICRSSDMIMVARGDLGVELPLEEVSIVQKDLIRKAHSHGIPTIVATQMLESMIENETPTRAEVADISNALLDNADILMLSDETAIGKHPLEAVSNLYHITNYVESTITEYKEPREFFGNRIAYSVARSAKMLSNSVDADIVALTKSGSTVKMLSALRPRGKIFVLTPNKRLISKLYLYNNTYPLDLDISDELSDDTLEILIQSGRFRRGEILIATSGGPYFNFGGTNDVKFLLMGNFIGRGKPSGPALEGRVTNNPAGDGEILIVYQPADIPSKTHFKGLVFTYPVRNSIIQEFTVQGKTVLSSTILKRRPEEGEIIFINPATGIIYN